MAANLTKYDRNTWLVRDADGTDLGELSRERPLRFSTTHGYIADNGKAWLYQYDPDNGAPFWQGTFERHADAVRALRDHLVK